MKHHILEVARNIVRKKHLDLNDEEKKETGVLDITVSFDGSWQKRGYKSLYGIGVVMKFYQSIVQNVLPQALANEESPESHSVMKTKLTEEVVAKILPVYQRLASNEILSRCTSGKSQNENESLHSVIWSHCPKESFQSKKRLEISVVTAVSEFNFVWIPVYLETYTSKCFITLDANQWSKR
ncbi:uncharacterized protein TNCV_4295951 [Trichonephila clavipes]|nr:uncharacterized protein TNCV_4295951 [Trichonephila clavipes]